MNIHTAYDDIYLFKLSQVVLNIDTFQVNLSSYHYTINI